MKRKRRYKKNHLPPYVVVKKGEWHVRRVFPTEERDAKGNLKYIQISRKCVPETPGRAAEIAAAIEQMVLSTQDEKPTRGTLGSFIQGLLDAKKTSVSRRTHAFYERIYNKHIKPAPITKMALDEIGPFDVQQFYTSLKTSAAMVKKVHVVLSMAFNQAVLWRLVQHNPSTGAILPKHRPKETPSLSLEEARAFIKACRTDPKYIIFELLLETGLRPQEALALRWSDIDMQSRSIRIERATEEGDGPIEIKDTKTQGSVRSVSFTSELKDRLMLHRGLSEVEKVKLRIRADQQLTTRQKRRGFNYRKRRRERDDARQVLDRISDNNLVFPSAVGKPRSRQNLNHREFQEVIKLAGLEGKGYSIKMLRHTYATLLAQHLQLKELQAQLGHTDIQTTAKFYIHVDDGSNQKASEQISELLY